MPRKAIYILVTKLGLTENEQRALIRKAVKLTSRDEEYIDDLTEPYRRKDKPLEQRAVAIGHMRSGDLLVIASPGMLGIGRDDVRSVLVQLARSGNGIIDVSTGKTVRWTPEAADAVEFLDRATLERKRGAADNARQAKMALNRTHIRDKKKLLVTEAQARQMWYDPGRYSAQEVAETCGVTSRTLYERFKGRHPESNLKRKGRR